MRKSLWVFLAISILLLAGLTVPGQVGKTNISDRQAVVIGDFSVRVREYVKLRKNVEDSFTSLNSSKDSAEIAAHKIELAAMIVSARAGARQGDIFTAEVEGKFREIIRKTLLSAEAQNVRRTIQDKDLEKPVVVRVNVTYPEDSPLQTMPPTLLGRLPELPMDMGYRIIGGAFVLLDNKTRLIVDFIPAALP